MPKLETFCIWTVRLKCFQSDFVFLVSTKPTLKRANVPQNHLINFGTLKFARFKVNKKFLENEFIVFQSKITFAYTAVFSECLLTSNVDLLYFSSMPWNLTQHETWDLTHKTSSDIKMCLNFVHSSCNIDTVKKKKTKRNVRTWVRYQLLILKQIKQIFLFCSH